MKLMSFVVPSYNSEAYLNHAIDSLLFDLEHVEIIIVNDGSKDGTIDIAKDYRKQYPNVVKVIDKENGGHGSGINAGLEIAQGLYFKVIDSDDWADAENGKLLLETIKKHVKEGKEPDLYIMNFEYEKPSHNTSFVRTYKKNLPTDEISDWNHMKKKFKYSSTMLMHALIYKTTVLKECELKLPEHTFYVDNIVAYHPIPHVKTFYYMDKVFYHYFIGREDQSVTMTNIVKRYEQQIRVFKEIMKFYTYDEIQKMPKGLKRYVKHNLTDMMVITQMFTTGECTNQRKKDLKTLWSELKAYDIKMYRFLKYRSYNTLVTFLPFRLKGFVMTKSYLYLTRKIKLG